MIANHIEYRDGYWYLDAMLHCDRKEYRRPGGGTEDDWEEYRNGEYELALLNGYCEELLQAYIANGNKVKQVFTSDF